MIGSIVRNSYVVQLREMKAYLRKHYLEEEAQPRILKILQDLDTMPLDLEMLVETRVAGGVYKCANYSGSLIIRLFADYLCLQFKFMWWETRDTTFIADEANTWQEEVYTLVDGYQRLIHEHIRFSTPVHKEVMYAVVEELLQLELDHVIVRYSDVDRTIGLMCEFVNDDHLSYLGGRFMGKCANYLMEGEYLK